MQLRHFMPLDPLKNLHVSLKRSVKRLRKRMRRIQVAALCLRDGTTGPEVLLITSRDTKRWVLPKGWPMAGKTRAHSAMQEAWEEAGVQATPKSNVAIGRYRYAKRLKTGQHRHLLTLVYTAKIDNIEDIFPEHHQRKRQWFPLAIAATKVHEPDLQKLFRRLARSKSGS